MVVMSGLFKSFSPTVRVKEGQQFSTSMSLLVMPFPGYSFYNFSWYCDSAVIRSDYCKNLTSQYLPDRTPLILN